MIADNRIGPCRAALLCMLTISSVLFGTHVVLAEVLFEDDFNDGLDDNWTMTWDWYWSDGRMYSDVGYNDNALGGGDYGCVQYLISFDLFPAAADQKFAFVVTSQLDPILGFGPPYCLDGYIAHIHTGTPGQIYAEYCGSLWMDYLGNESILTPGIIYHVQFGHLDGNLVYRHWAEGSPAPDWLYSKHLGSGATYQQGYWYIFVLDDGPGTWIDNFQVDGLGVVQHETMSWGNLKGQYGK